MALSVEAFSQCISDSGLLSPQTARDFQTLLAMGLSAEQVAQEVVNRGWLTHFQVRRLWHQRTAELFVGQYVLLDRLGTSSFGELYRAWHRRMQRMCALRVLPKALLADPQRMKQFVDSIQKASRLSNPHIAVAYDAGQHGDKHFFATEYIEGITLAQMVRDGRPLPLKVAANYIRQAAIGLSHAHEQNLLHSKLQPASLIVNKQDDQLKILDLGLTFFADNQIRKDVPLSVADFQAPELSRQGLESEQADVYSLGCIFYYLLSGKVPFPSKELAEKPKLHALQVIPDPRVQNPKLPGEVVNSLQRIMAKRPETRVQSALELANMLQIWCPGGSSAHYARTQQMDVEPITEGDVEVVDVEINKSPVAPPPFPKPVVAATVVTQPIEQPEETFAFDPNQPSQPDLIRIPVEEPQRSGLAGWIIAGLVCTFAGIVALWAYTSFFRQTSDADLPAELVNAYKLRFVKIPAGQFQMGSLDGELGRKSDEGPVHTVKITKAFYLMIHEVNQAQYLSLRGTRPAVSRQYRNSENMPVETVSYEDAEDFCQELNLKGMQGIPKGFRYRLPTEAEWEYACRAGSDTPFWPGNDISTEQFAVEGSTFEERPLLFPRQIMSGSPNRFGLFDMHGNVAEWTQDWYDKYSEGEQIDPTGPNQGRRKVVRGGGWNTPAALCRSAARRSENTLFKDAALGFRVVLAREDATAPKEKSE